MLPAIDITTFWDDSDYYTNPAPLTPAMVSQAEKQLGYMLPDSYIQLLTSKNGGTPRNTRFPTATPTSWADDHIAISGICGLGGQWGIDSMELGSKFMLEEWGYPPIGIVVAQCPSAGHDAVMLDYRRCGAQGEPQVVHVSVEEDEEPNITFLADNFQEFLAGLVNEEQFAVASSNDDFSDFQTLPAAPANETATGSAPDPS
ncbi:SMI1/KNR4 family protein [Hymenobacter tibetensis]|uniref:SMI1/KNR4 family protein n=1 Tax=Hymenobacter tibetensis TaxID=497967 RepID=A0ABY4CRR8_9BACT|nr:SMI1/KNR4 family protein [Hymenobacter tibetensis]UOG72949.1 SMI1/KNR4 family protein [Hymenobacter tibetensis]